VRLFVSVSFTLKFFSVYIILPFGSTFGLILFEYKKRRFCARVREKETERERERERMRERE